MKPEKTMKLDDIKLHWENWAREYETNLRATTKTPTIKKLEINAIYKAISNTPYRGGMDVLEVGCGNGYNCFALAELLDGFYFTGVDYVADMIKNAETIKLDNQPKFQRVNFRVGDLLKLDDDKNLKEAYDFVFTDRCIINLNSVELHLKALDQLVRKVKTGGYLIILENIDQTYRLNNNLRETVGLPPRNPASFNLFIDEERFLAHAVKSLELIRVDDFGSLHDVILYVLTPMVNNGDVDYEHPMVKAAAELSAAVSDEYSFGSYGQNRLYLFRKTS